MTQETVSQILQRLEYNPAEFASPDWEVATVAPFRVALNPELGVSEAAPVDSLSESSPVDDAIKRLLELVAARGCALELQYNEALWPGLSRALEPTRLLLRKREVLMICRPETFRPNARTDVEARFLDPADPPCEFEAFRWVQTAEREAKLQKMEDREFDRFRNEIGVGANCEAVLARLRGQPVGTGYSWCNSGRCEITRMHTTPAARRQGVASTVMTLLLERAFERCGDLIWVTASGPPAQALYEKVGFRSIGYRRFYVPRKRDCDRDS